MTQFQGKNSANYNNEVFNTLFNQMKNMENNAERQVIIQQCLEILRKDAPWVWGYHPKTVTLHHQWYLNSKTNIMANNTLKYQRIDPDTRSNQQRLWNKLVWKSVILFMLLLLFSCLPAVVAYKQKVYGNIR